MSRSRLTAFFWKISSGLVIAMTVFGQPLADGLPFLPTVPVAYAAFSPDVEEPPHLLCGPSVLGTSVVTCTDLGVYQATIERVKDRWQYQLSLGALKAVMDAGSLFAQTIAYDTAEWMASGFKGQAPGIFTDPFGDYTQSLVLDTMGEFMGSFSDNFTKGILGVDLCRPPNFPQLSLEFQLGIPQLGLNAVQRPRPKCSWTELASNWEQSVQSMDNLNVLENSRANFTYGGNDISFGVGAHLALFDAIAEKRSGGILDRLEGAGFKPVTDFITGNIQSPASVVEAQFTNNLITYPSARQNMLEETLQANVWSAGAIQIGLLTASTFTNVLVSRLLQRISSGLFKSTGPSGSFNLADINIAPGSSTQPKEIFASQFSDLKTARVNKNDAQDLLTELSTCPDVRTKWSCAMDEAFASALRTGGGMTLRQAIDQGFIKPEWELLPSSRIQDNQDPSCRSRAFCVANLRKMRLARVISVGWELAADSQANQQSCGTADGCITLAEVMDRFDDCNASGQLDASHPYCHLIDPNWVLTIFPAQCQTEGYGNQLLGGTNQRVPECQDTVSCLQRDKDGNCVGGYGFCMAEQTFWQFDAPSCKAQFSSCRTYMPRGSNAKAVSYLRSTVDYGTCNEGNVGCMWYATRRDAAAIAAGADVDVAWSATTTPNTTPGIHPTNASERVYFDKNVQSCDASNEGCTALRRVVQGQSALNLIPDGSFENVTGTTPIYQEWVKVTGSPKDLDATPQTLGSGAGSFDGTRALYSTVSVRTARQVVLQPVRSYTLSFYARQFSSTPNGATVEVGLTNTNNASVATPPSGVSYYRSSGCTIASNGGAGVNLNSALNIGDEWTRFSCTFVTPPDVGFAQLRITPGNSAASTPLIDAIQLEETEQPTQFVQDVNTSLATLHMKVPPDELACSGAATDNPLCANFARVCRQAEAGCQGYTPRDGGGAPEVPAVLTDGDRCPAECVGYAEFRKQPSTFDLVRNTVDARLDDPADDTVASFIPSTGQSCSAQDVGCEQFTNLDAATVGGEAQPAFRYLRMCEKPDAASQTYYTWEGSDASGYQLHTWSLKRDLSAPFPQGPKVVEKAGPDGVLKTATACNATTYLGAFDPDCRQFYDPQGNVFYRYETQTVLSSDSCAQYRKDNTNVADCEKTGGTFNTATNQCTYLAEGSQSLTCAPAVAGCRAYAGTQGNAEEEIFSEEFNGTAFQATGNDTGSGGTTLAKSDESLLVGDSSLRVQANGSSRNVYLGPMKMQAGALYELTFWAKAQTPNATFLIRTTPPGAASFTTVATINTTPGWQTYRVGPFTVPTSDDIRVVIQSAQADTWFLDRVRVTRVNDIAYVVKNSWNTPAMCDQTPEGTPQPQAMLGCRAYTDRNGNSVTVRQFTNLCREEVIGCTAYVNTRNTETPYDQLWTKDSPRSVSGGGVIQEQTLSFGDRYDYYVEDPTKYCPGSADGCRAFGKPNYTQSRLSLDPQKPFSTVWLIDRPDQYDAALCSEKELFCEAYTYAASNGEAGTSYFRAPGEHACEYRTAVVVPDGSVTGLSTAGRTYDGWFQVGTDVPCHPDRLENGGVFGIRLTGDIGYNEWLGANSSANPLYPTGQDYRGWTATCPAAQAECTEFRDVNDTSDPLRPGGRQYFVINDNNVDQTSCNGTVDPGRGCVLFRDTSQNTLNASTVATYDLYKQRAYQPVAPVDCVATPNHPSCLATGTTANDANVIIKVKPDRSCSEWLSCATAETVYDPQTGQYKSLCSNLALCNKAGSVEGAGIPFCANYVDRTAASTQTLLIQNRVLDAATYATRLTGFGAKDYSGASLPDHFQLMDAKLKPVGNFLNPDPATRGKFAKDYRLVVPVVMVNPQIPLVNSGTGVLGSYTQAGAATPAEAAALAGAPAELIPYACVLTQTGAYGIMTDPSGILTTSGASGNLCWVALDQTLPPQLGVSGAAIVSDNLNMLNLIGRLTQSDVPEMDQTLSASLPDAQCKAAPEADAPFGNQFVVEWDGSVAPPKPSRVLSGYAQSNFCEYGEQCACTYKRVEYGGPGNAKFYEPLSTDVVNAVCVGGSRSGQPCVVDAGISGSTSPSGAIQVPDPADSTKTKTVDLSQLGGETGGSAGAGCGEGGVCTPITGSKLVRGAAGECLQYDLSRNVGGDSSRNECLFWSPNPIFSGPSDPYHWIPTAGFQPPQSSGRYYCTSPYRKPRTIAIKPDVSLFDSLGSPQTASKSVGFKRNGAGRYAGLIDTFWYRDAIASDGSCFSSGAAVGAGIGFAVGGPLGGLAGGLVGDELDTCDGNEAGGSLDGALSDGTDMGLWCEQADDDQSPASDPASVRMVTTGKGQNRGYAEYAIMMNPQQIGQAIAGYNTQTPYSKFNVSDRMVIDESSLEDVISSFEFSVIPRKLGCAYSEDWVQGIGGLDYDNKNSWTPQDQAWQAGFRQALNAGGGKLDRKKSQIVTQDGSPTGIPVKVNCVDPAHQDDNAEEAGCFLKTWELNYRSEGQVKFQGLGQDIGRPDLDSLSKTPVYGKCDSDHSWFSIRAVFEDTDPTENATAADQINPNALMGPFQFIGFWVTACSPASGPRYIYMRVNMSTADVCRELAETISKDSHESTAFTDRNSSKSGFTIPRNGFSWSTTNIPFGASLATGDAGEEPLYMSGVKQAQANGLHPPIFTYPGQTYFRSEKYPTNNWGLLSNIFARIYRIYGYNVKGVSKNDWACTNPASPNFGQWCPDLDAVPVGQQNALARQYCGYEAKCQKTGFSGTDVFDQKVCNAFSGVNRGLDCSNDPDICHMGPVSQNLDGTLVSEFTTCDVRSVANQEEWTQMGSGAWRCTGGACPTVFPTNGTTDCTPCSAATGCARVTAMQCGAFRCAANSARAPGYFGTSGSPQFASVCTRPTVDPGQTSRECPRAIDPGSEACIDIVDGIGQCAAHPWAQCGKDADCAYEARNWWAAAPANQSFASSRLDADAAIALGYRTNNLANAFPSSSANVGWYGFPFSMTNSIKYTENDNAMLRTAFTPAFVTNGESKFYLTSILTTPSITDTATLATWDDRSLLKLYPGFVPLISSFGGPGTCSPNFTDSSGGLAPGCSNPFASAALRWVGDSVDTAPYGHFEWNPEDTSSGVCQASGAGRFVTFRCSGGANNGQMCLRNADCQPPANQSQFMRAHYAACEPLALMFQDGITGSRIPGSCRGGNRAGSTCYEDNDCLPDIVRDSSGKVDQNKLDDLNDEAATWCNPAALDLNGNIGLQPDNAACWPDGADPNNPRFPLVDDNSATDSNICTHPAGYWPRPAYCKDPNDEYCGLFGYDLAPAGSALNNSVNDSAALPTDVTPGLYTPTYLNQRSNRNLSSNDADYNYIRYYNPIPPLVAAPDMRTCQGGTCRTATVGSVGVDGINEGIVNGGAGTHVAALRFYAWAAHEQMPLRRVIIDWGDGNQTELPDAHLKNHKPYCGGQKECSLSPGLTCQSDTDCPPGGGSCVEYGSCVSDPNKRCTRDAECDTSDAKGVCQPRVYFGNDVDACEEQYFEFRHAYACLPNNRPTAACPGGNHCSSDPNRTCTSIADCGAGDRCIPNTAITGGCFNSASNTCQFTPRVYLVDNWGWCAGECRSAISPQTGKPIDDTARSDASVRHPNGGCYDISRVKSNVDFTTPVSDAGGPVVNECATSRPVLDGRYHMRPWIVFPGSMQLRAGESN
jgi:hypothetical protein